MEKSGDGGNTAVPVTHCKWCEVRLNVEDWRHQTPQVWAAWLSGYCGPLHQKIHAAHIVDDGAAWWQKANPRSER
jgi:hypothetical protein